MRQVASLLGYYPIEADCHGQARYRPHGSLCIDFSQGLYMDYAAGSGGGVFDFIRAETGEEPGDWLKRHRIGSHSRGTARPRIRRCNEDVGAKRRDFTTDELKRIADARRVWDQAQPTDGVSEVASYLAARGGLDVGACTNELRYSPSVAWENERRGCLLVAYRNFYTNEITGLSRILLDEARALAQNAAQDGWRCASSRREADASN